MLLVNVWINPSLKYTWYMVIHMEIHMVRGNHTMRPSMVWFCRWVDFKQYQVWWVSETLNVLFWQFLTSLHMCKCMHFSFEPVSSSSISPLSSEALMSRASITSISMDSICLFMLSNLVWWQREGKWVDCENISLTTKYTSPGPIDVRHTHINSSRHKIVLLSVCACARMCVL